MRFSKTQACATSRAAGVAVGAGGPCSRVVTVSLDQSAKIWSLATGERLATVAFPAKCTAVVLDPAEQEMYVGCSDAVIYAVGLAAAVGENRYQRSAFLPVGLLFPEPRKCWW